MQFCRVGAIDSETNHIEAGVSQGSCLSPLLLLAYSNDLPCGIHSSSVSLYADDTSLFIKSKNLTQRNEAMHGDLKSLESRSKGNKISLTVAKTHSCFLLKM